MKKYNKSEIFKAAWKMVREFVVSLSEALKKAWEDAKKKNSTNRFRIKDWFFNKYFTEKFTTAHCECFSDFYSHNVLKETEKAIFVELDMMVSATGYDTSYTKKVWIPKSAVEIHAVQN